MTERNYQQDIEKVRNFAQSQMPNLLYHNIAHVEDVVRAIRVLAPMEGCTPHELYELVTAGYLHDIGYSQGSEEHEEDGAKKAAWFLNSMAYAPRDILSVAGLIRATKIPTNPKNKLEMIICDADLDNLGRTDFLEKNALLRKEIGLGAAEHTEKWYMQTLEFLNNHRYYTESARKLRQLQLNKNLAEVGNMILHFPR